MQYETMNNIILFSIYFQTCIELEALIEPKIDPTDQNFISE